MFRKKLKGFTLIEILLVFAVVAILAVAALGSYLNTSKTFSFLNNYESVMNMIRVARSYAITNFYTSPGEEAPLDTTRYIFAVTSATRARIYADVGTDPFAADKDDVLIKTLSLTSTPYTLGVTNGLALPIYFFYEASTGELTIYEGSDILDERCVEFSFTDGERTRYILIFTLSGIPEASNKTTAC